ncbi:hypothetical protein CRYUN_Cryun24cG0023500 [Craigia yunnanensis]
MKHFVLIHGMCHGAWCWYKVVSLLKSAGHRVTPLDLGASGINSKKTSELASLSDYAQPLMEFMASLPQEEKVILVGHSYGGIIISLAMESYPKQVLAGVYLTAFMPNHDSPPAIGVEKLFKRVMAEPIIDFQLWFDDGPENPPTNASFGPTYMAENVYQLSPKEDIELAKTVLRQGKWFMKELSKESLLTKEKFGSVNRVYIVCNDDLTIKESLQKWYIEHSPTGDVKFIPGADHMPMFSKPKEYFETTPKESLLDFQFSFDDGLEKPPTSALFGPNFLATKVFQSCRKEDLAKESLLTEENFGSVNRVFSNQSEIAGLELAKTLLRPTGLFLKDLAKESLLTEENFGSVNRVFILSKEDELFNEHFQRWFVEISPTKDVKVIEGADHMSMLSKPKELCLCFLEIAEEYN